MTATALIIDDEPDIRELVTLTLNRMGLDIHSAANLEEARSLLAAYNFDVCLTDMRLPDGNGVDFVRYIQSTQPNLPVAVITAHGNMDAAVEAMKNGAYDFVSKPVDIHQLRRLVVQAVAVNANSANDAVLEHTPVSPDKKGLQENPDTIEPAQPASVDHSFENSHSLEQLSHRDQATSSVQPLIGADHLIGSSEPMQELRRMILKLSRTNAPVWITGESGTGKELIARLIHSNSPRANSPFVAINCGAIPSELMESELFGHKKGSFTGATSDHDGLFVRAHGGTLFLDEVAELPLHMQVKLLRAIQERTVRAVGGTDEHKIDVRILSASHKDPGLEVDEGRFRHDLYYRLNVIALEAPSLRNRTGDIPELVAFVLNKICREHQMSEPTAIADEAVDALENYHFPGNVRELENLLERAVALCENQTITQEDLQISSRSTGIRDISPSSPTSDSSGSFNAEKHRLISALNDTRWNRKAAAEQLGLTYRQLRYRIQQLGIDKSDDH
ncbi:MAG: sigma-54 dependent transcriptional regulator [Gammaproteobacteria bacterium]|nr:sigma-54 dependent transcriptional regulator [Gammaproteobacteria bacterium]